MGSREEHDVLARAKQLQVNGQRLGAAGIVLLVAVALLGFLPPRYPNPLRPLELVWAFLAFACEAERQAPVIQRPTHNLDSAESRPLKIPSAILHAVSRVCTTLLCA